jgi:hypothetical protein
MGTMDGNNSLKLIDATFLSSHSRHDNWASTSFRWLTPDQVNIFKDEVTNSQKVCRSDPIMILFLNTSTAGSFQEKT